MRKARIMGTTDGKAIKYFLERATEELSEAQFRCASARELEIKFEIDRALSHVRDALNGIKE